MTATKTPAAYTSGHCGARAHSRCRGAYAGTPCDCDCHQEPGEPKPEILGEIAAALTEIAIVAAVQHCPTCTCGVV